MRGNENTTMFGGSDGAAAVSVKSPAEWCVGFSILYASIRFLVSSANAEDAGRTEKLYEKLMVSRGNCPKVATLQVSEVLLCRNIPDLK